MVEVKKEEGSILDELYKDPSQLALFIIVVIISIVIRLYIRKPRNARINQQAKQSTNDAKSVSRRQDASRKTTKEEQSDIELIDILVYPIKSCKGFSVQKWGISKYGLENDRRWMIINSETNRFVTQRQNPKMALIVPTFEDENLVLNAPDASEIKISIGANRRTSPLLDVSIWDDNCTGIDEGDEVSDWLCKVLGGSIKYRLVRLSDDHARKTEDKYQVAGAENVYAYQDGFPFLIASMESLSEVNKRLEDKSIRLPMNRFRPNFVVRGVSAPFDEDNFGRFKLGDTIFNAVKKCTRCRMTTVDQAKGQFAGDEPLNILHTFREGLLSGKKEEVCFGENLTHENYNTTIEVGQKVEFL